MIGVRLILAAACLLVAGDSFAQGFSIGGGGGGISVGGGHERERHPGKRHHEKRERHHGGGVGFSITVEPSEEEPGSRKQPEKAPATKGPPGGKKAPPKIAAPPAKPKPPAAPPSVIAVPEVPCPEPVKSLLSDADYWREQADALDQEAKEQRKFAERWRKIGKEAADGAKFAEKAGLDDSQEWHEGKAAELEQRAEDYEASAAKKEAEAKALREKADAEEKRVAEREREWCERQKTRTVFTPPPPPEPAPSSSPPAQPVSMCGPDITDNVLRVLDRMFNDWERWDSSKKAEKCRDLINPLTALSAWDIKELSPGTAPLSEKKYKEFFGGTKGYEKYLRNSEFWFEGAAAACAKPRWPCGHTVTFLGQCVHAQVVNYMQWGAMTKLCELDWSADSVHYAYSFTAPKDTYQGQKLMSAVGSAYTAATGAGKHYIFQSADPGELPARREAMKQRMAEEMKRLMAGTDYPDFANRPGSVCTVPCAMTAAEKAKLEKKTFGYEWGYGSRLGVGGR